MGVEIEIEIETCVHIVKCDLNVFIFATFRACFARNGPFTKRSCAVHSVTHVNDTYDFC